MKPRTLIPGIGLLVLLLLGITRTSGAVDSPGADRGEAMAGELLVGVRPESDDRWQATRLEQNPPLPRVWAPSVPGGKLPAQAE